METNNNLQSELFSKIIGSGLDITKLPEILKQVKQFVPMVKTFLPLVKEYEKTLKLQTGQKLIYSCMVEQSEAYLYLFVMEQNEKGETLIVNQLGKISLSEGLEKITNFLPF